MSERRIFRSLVSADEALKRLSEHFKAGTRGVEEVSIVDAYGRVLAEDITSPFDVPGFDRALMDGYAVRAQDTFGAEEDRAVRLRVTGTVEPGQKPAVEIKPREAVEIATGAPVPKGANAVVMVEYTQRRGDKVDVHRPVTPGENIMAAGTDIMAGELVLKRGQRLTPREMGVAAALGLERVKVYRRPVVAILSTGDEIVRPGAAIEYGKIYDINASSVSGAVLEAGCVSLHLGVIPDREEVMEETLRHALASADIVLTSGSTSAGAGDMMYRVIDKLGEPGVLVHGLTLKPGKPTILAVVDGKPVIALPGYPTSALMIYSVVVRPLLLRMAGLPEASTRPAVGARMAFRTFVGRGRRELLPVHLVADDRGEFFAYPVEGGSGAISSLAMADGFVDAAETREFLEEGEGVSVSLFGAELKPADLVIIGSHCVGLDVMARLILSSHGYFDAKIVNAGSLGGLRAVGKGEADLAGTHLLDEDSGVYNTPFLQRLGLQDHIVLVKGYRREQGIIVQRGNPKSITSLKDLLRSDVTIINRNPGSGTRVLLDLHLKRLASELSLEFSEVKKGIRGYDIEAKSHSAVAAAVAQGRADAGVGIRTVAALYGLDFIHVADEEYDFAVGGSRMEKPGVRLFLETLKSPEFADALKREAAGLLTHSDTGSVIRG